MLLPLLEKAKEQSAHFLLTPKTVARSSGARQCGTPFAPKAAGIPQRALLPGEQYRFHFDMTKCIGCKCCVVACNEQNGNPPDINWRRVGEIEGGWYPDTQRLHLSSDWHRMPEEIRSLHQNANSVATSACPAAILRQWAQIPQHKRSCGKSKMRSWTSRRQPLPYRIMEG